MDRYLGISIAVTVALAAAALNMSNQDKHIIPENSKVGTASASLSEEEYNVLSAVFQALADEDDIESAVVQSDTFLSDWEGEFGSLPFSDLDVPKPMARSLFDNNKQSCTVEEHLVLGIKYELLTKNQINGDQMSDSGEFTKPILYTSRPGFNTEMNRAVIVAGVAFGPLGGGESIFVLHKKDGKWVVIDSKIVSIA